MLAQRYAETNPVANTIIGLSIVLLIVALVVFHRPIGRALHWIEMKIMQRHGAADPELDVEQRVRGVLWVDDRPENNVRLLDQLEREGVPVDVARSTSEAMEHLDARSYAIILSDMSRLEDGVNVLDAGLRLLRQTQEHFVVVPFVIYSKYETLSTTHTDEALVDGAAAVTSSEAEVLDWLRAVDLLPQNPRNV